MQSLQTAANSGEIGAASALCHLQGAQARGRQEVFRRWLGFGWFCFRMIIRSFR